jgi:hypothetical protein
MGAVGIAGDAEVTAEVDAEITGEIDVTAEVEGEVTGTGDVGAAGTVTDDVADDVKVTDEIVGAASQVNDLHGQLAMPGECLERSAVLPTCAFLGNTSIRALIGCAGSLSVGRALAFFDTGKCTDDTSEEAALGYSSAGHG